MKTRSSLLLIALALPLIGNVQAQSNKSVEQATRPRTVTSTNTVPAKPEQRPAQSTTATRSSQPATKKAANHFQQDEARAVAKDEANRRLTPNRLRIRISEAQRLMKARPVPTAMTPSLDFVTIAALLPETSQIHLIRVNKQTFLTKGAEVSGVSTMGLPVQVRIVRANGVNTAVTIFDDKNRSLLPLVVEFPIERAGKFREMAYYTSAHPALLSADLMKAGQTYVNSMVDLAARRLRDRGNLINPMLVDIAKHLCIVEHVDHERFRNENRIALYEEIYTLYALNELDTYRFSVSSAGAGGMVQMIPWTYNLMRQRHPGVGLNPDFVFGMRNHGNALEAMLLYMQDTWNDLSANEDVQAALTANQATNAEIMAAGYNSNAAKLPGYIRRAGAGWRTLIPRETQMYLQIYQSLDVLMKAKENHARKK
ncbi:MAG TPA: hypothetical protein VHQ64_15560 [Pyrinomonadaceae bacterium]|jgi:hypothetical protein|nr:hypothetical protein [Pyrinomonadaceae bacterium]